MTPVVVAHQQNPATGHLYSLTIDGLDVIGQVDPESIRATEAGPGAVSSMGFTILDPSKLVTIADNARIVMWDHTRDLPVFAGFVESQSPIPGYGGQGRDIEVTAYGIAALLDQIIVPSLTLSTATVADDLGTEFSDTSALQVLAGYLPLRAFAPPAGRSTQAGPVEATPRMRQIQSVVLDGMSIRAAFEAWVDKAGQIDSSRGYTAAHPALDVDAWGGVRKFGIGLGSTSQTPLDYTTLTVTDAVSGTAAANLRWTRDTSPGQVVTAVYVKGGNAAGTGWVVGDTTKGRAEAYVSDSAITTQAQKEAAAGAILGRKGTGVGRGSLRLESFTPINARTGGPLTITNTALGWAAKAFVISQIDKTFLQTGKQDWTVSFFDANDVPSAGGPSLARLIRSITRSLS